MNFIGYTLYFNKADENLMPFWALLYTSSLEQDINGESFVNPWMPSGYSQAGRKWIVSAPKLKTHNLRLGTWESSHFGAQFGAGSRGKGQSQRHGLPGEFSVIKMNSKGYIFKRISTWTHVKDFILLMMGKPGCYMEEKSAKEYWNECANGSKLVFPQGRGTPFYQTEFICGVNRQELSCISISYLYVTQLSHNPHRIRTRSWGRVCYRQCLVWHGSTNCFPNRGFWKVFQEPHWKATAFLRLILPQAFFFFKSLSDSISILQVNTALKVHSPLQNSFVKGHFRGIQIYFSEHLE